MEIEDSTRVLQDNHNQTVPRQPLKDDRWEQFCLAVTYWIDHEDGEEHTAKRNDENKSAGRLKELYELYNKPFHTRSSALSFFLCLEDFRSALQTENVAPLYHLQSSRTKKDLHGMEVRKHAYIHVCLCC